MTRKNEETYMRKTLTEKQAIKLVKKHPGCWLSFDGLTALTDEAAATLAKHTGGGLTLNGLTALTDEAAAQCLAPARAARPSLMAKLQ